MNPRYPDHFPIVSTTTGLNVLAPTLCSTILVQFILIHLIRGKYLHFEKNRIFFGISGDATEAEQKHVLFYVCLCLGRGGYSYTDIWQVLILMSGCSLK